MTPAARVRPSDAADLEFARRLSLRQARSLRDRGAISEIDREDLAGDLLAEVLTEWSRYDPARGARRALIRQVVSSRGASLVRRRSARKRGSAQLDRLSERLPDSRRSRAGLPPDVDLRIDVEAAMARLSRYQVELCVALGEFTLTEVAAARGVARSTLRAEVARIRRAFRAAGLEAHLGRNVRMSGPTGGGR